MNQNKSTVFTSRECVLVITLFLSFLSPVLFAQENDPDVPLAFDLSRESLVRTVRQTEIYPTPNIDNEPIATLQAAQLVWASKTTNGFSLVYDRTSQKQGWVSNGQLQWAGPSNEQGEVLDRFNQERDRIQFESVDQVSEWKSTIDLENRVKAKLEQFDLNSTPYASPNSENLIYGYLNLNQFENALQEAKQEFETLNIFLGENDMRTVLAKSRVAICMAAVQDENASELFDEVLGTTESLLGKKNLIYLDLLSRAAVRELNGPRRLELWGQSVDLAREMEVAGVELAQYLIGYGNAIMQSQPPQPADAIPYFRQAIKLLGDSDHRIQKGECLLSLGRLRSMLDEYRSAEENLGKAIEIFRAEDKDLVAKEKLADALYQLGQVHSLRRNERAAVATFQEAIELETAGAFDHRISLIGSLLKLGKKGDARAVAREALSQLEMKPDEYPPSAWYVLARETLNIGDVLEAEKLVAKGMSLLEKNQESERSLNDFRGLTAAILIEKGQIEEGLSLKQTTIDYLIENQGIENCHYDLHNYADALLFHGKKESALRIHKEIYEMRRKKYGDSHNCSQASLIALGEIYIAKSDFEKARDSFLVALKAQDGRGRTDLEGL